MVEVIPQKTFHYGDGVPAYKSGEWYGSKPNHFIGSKLILKPIKHPEKEFKIGHSIHYPPKYSKEYKPHYDQCMKELEGYLQLLRKLLYQ